MGTLDSQGAGPQPELGSVAPELGAGFAAETANVNGTTIHYVRGGRGPAVVLLHGFPQDWFEWRRVMPRLSQRFTVVAVDLRGVGGSAPSASGYASVPDGASQVMTATSSSGCIRTPRTGGASFTATLQHPLDTA